MEEKIDKKFLKIGMLVDIVFTRNNNEEIERGYIKEIISKGSDLKRIKVKLTSQTIGFVDHIVTKSELKQENFKFYNIFFYEKELYSIWDKKQNKYLVVEKTNRNTGASEKVAFLFNKTEIGNEVVTLLKNNDLMLRSINRKKPIIDNFKTLDIDFFNINKTRKIEKMKLIEWENHFKSF